MMTLDEILALLEERTARFRLTQSEVTGTENRAYYSGIVDVLEDLHRTIAGDDKATNDCE